MHKNFLRALPRTLLSAALVAGITTTAGVFAVDGNPPGLFELDGNTAPSDSWPGDDWDNVYLKTMTQTPAASTGIIPDPAPKSIFTGGGSKDVNDVTQWRYTDGNVPDKDDITNAYALGYVNPTDVTYDGKVVHHAGDLMLYFGLDRLANNGDAFAGFWFFQKDVDLGPNGTFTAPHTARTATQHGDVLVLVEYPQGANTMPVIKVYEWDPADLDHDNVAPNLHQLYTSENSGNAKCDGAGNKLACAITNNSDLPGAPAWPYKPKNGYAGIPFESFFEGGINVSALLGGDVPCFSSFLAETRSSRSETAQLKDLVRGDFNLCSVKVTKDCTAVVSDKDGGNSVVVSFDGKVTNDGGLPMTVTVSDDNGTPGDTSDDKRVFGPTLMQPGEEQSYSGSFNTMAIPSTDWVTATAVRGSTTVTAKDDATCQPVVTPALTVTKTCKTEVNAEGSGVNVIFEGIVKNTGNVALKDVIVVDDSGTPGNTSDDVTLKIGTLDANASAPYNSANPAFFVPGVTHSTDVVTVSGVDVLMGKTASATQSASCNSAVTPKLEITKTCEAKIDSSGTGIVVDFKGVVTNSGQEILKDVMVTDNYGSGDVAVVERFDLSPGMSKSYEGSFPVSGKNSSTDTTTATATGLLSQQPISVSSQAATCETPVVPKIAVTKQCTDAPAFGQPIQFSGVVTNTGNVALSNVIVVDDNGTPADTLDDVTIPVADLAPGASLSYSGSYTPAKEGTWTNTVVASANDAILGQSVSSSTVSASCKMPPPQQFEGCTPGFWKNSTGSWPPTGYSPSQTVASVFSLPNGVISQLGSDSLLTALGYQGGSDLKGAAQILLRAAVSAVLNAAHPEVNDYPLSAADVIAKVNAALATKDRNTILALASLLDGYNNLGCPLANDNSF